MTEFLLLFFVFVGELGLAAVIYLAEAISKDYAVWTFFAVYFLQFITSTIQGGISDHSLRKKSLLVAFNAVLIGQIFFILAFKHHYMLIGSIALYGFLGNITPIARAALADTELKDNFRLSVGLSTIAIALGWVLMAFAAYYMPPFLGCLLVTVLCAACNLLVYYIKDPEDKPTHKPFTIRGELSLITSIFKHPEIYWGLVGYLVAEIAFYQIFARGKGQVFNPEVRFIVTTWVFGYIIGAILQHYLFRKGKENSGIKWGVFVSIISMMFLIVFTLYGFKNCILVGAINSSFALGFGFFIPCLFSIVSQRYKPHLQGKIYGLIDAVDSVALMIAVAINHIPSRFSLMSLMISSLILTIAAFFCFVMTIKQAQNGVNRD